MRTSWISLPLSAIYKTAVNLVSHWYLLRDRVLRQWPPCRSRSFQLACQLEKFACLAWTWSSFYLTIFCKHICLLCTTQKKLQDQHCPYASFFRAGKLVPDNFSLHRSLSSIYLKVAKAPPKIDLSRSSFENAFQCYRFPEPYKKKFDIYGLSFLFFRVLVLHMLLWK